MADDGQDPVSGRMPGELDGSSTSRNRKRRRRKRMSPAFVSGTSSEFLGRRPLPRTARERPVIFLLGPPGVGKSAVARRLLDHDDIRHLTGAELHDALANQVRRRTWRDDIRHHPALILDGPAFLHRRPAVMRMLQQLLQLRAQDGLRTMVCEGEDRSPLTDLMMAVEAEARATIALRFPVGQGRRRYAARVCDELGIDRRYAARTDDLEPWTYDSVIAQLRQIRDEQRRERRRRRRHALRVCEKLQLPRHMVDRVMHLEPYDKAEATRVLTELREEMSRSRRRKRRRRNGKGNGGSKGR